MLCVSNIIHSGKEMSNYLLPVSCKSFLWVFQPCAKDVVVPIKYCLELGDSAASAGDGSGLGGRIINFV